MFFWLGLHVTFYLGGHIAVVRGVFLGIFNWLILFLASLRMFWALFLIIFDFIGWSDDNDAFFDLFLNLVYWVPEAEADFFHQGVLCIDVLLVEVFVVSVPISKNFEETLNSFGGTIWHFPLQGQCFDEGIRVILDLFDSLLWWWILDPSWYSDDVFCLCHLIL